MGGQKMIFTMMHTAFYLKKKHLKISLKLIVNSMHYDLAKLTKKL